MNWLASLVLEGLHRAWEQFGSGLLEPHGFDLQTEANSTDTADPDERSDETRDADIAYFLSFCHF